MKRLVFIILQTLVAASLCIEVKVAPSEGSDLKRKEKSKLFQFGRKGRTPYSYGGYIPQFQMRELQSDGYGIPEDYEIDEDGYYQEDASPYEQHMRKKGPRYNGQHQQKKSQTFIHEHIHSGHGEHKHKHEGEGKHYHSHKGHGYHDHKHEGHGVHEHKHHGYGKHEHKHSGHGEHGHHHKGNGEHFHYHIGQGKHEHKHKGHGEHGHRHVGSGDHKHYHAGQGKHEHGHYGIGSHKHDHKGYGEHSHKHAGQGLYDHKHFGLGIYDHKHYGSGAYDHQHYGIGHQDHKHYGSGLYQHKQMGNKYQSNKQETPFKLDDSFKSFFDTKDSRFPSFAGIDFDGFHSFGHRSDASPEAPSHPDIVFYGNDPDLYNYYVQKKEMIKNSQFDGEKRIDEEPSLSVDEFRYPRSEVSAKRTFSGPGFKQNSYTSKVEHKVDSDEDGSEEINRRQLIVEDDEPDVIYGTLAEGLDYIGPKSQYNEQLTRPRNSGRAVETKRKINQKSSAARQNFMKQSSNDESHYIGSSNSPTEQQQYQANPENIQDNARTNKPQQKRGQRKNHFKADNSQTTPKKKYFKSVKYTSSLVESDQTPKQNIYDDYDGGVISTNGPVYENSSDQKKFTPKKTAPTFKPRLSLNGPQYIEPYKPKSDGPQKIFSTEEKVSDYISSRFNSPQKFQEFKPTYDEKQPALEISRSLYKDGFLPSEGDTPHLIQYNVVHGDTKSPSMSYFSQLRAIS